MAWVRVCKTSQVDDDFPFSARVDGLALGIYRVDGEYYALEDVCPHSYALLSQGIVDEGCVECPLHGARFDIKTGTCLREPAERDLAVYPVRVVEGQVEVELP